MPETGPAGTRFAILAAPRTGSNWLCSLINSHPDILCHHEVFNPHGIFYALDCRDTLDLGTMDDRDRQPLEFLDRLWQYGLGHGCVGFKMTRGQDGRVLQAVLNDRSVRKIVLHRRNLLRTYVSEEIAKQTGRWEVYNADELVQRPSRIHVGIDALQQHLESNEAFYGRIERQLRDTRQRFLEVWYEELFADDSHARLLAFLGVPLKPLVAKSVRQNPGRLSELISNYHDLEAAFGGSRFEPFLDAEDKRDHAGGLQQNG